MINKSSKGFLKTGTEGDMTTESGYQSQYFARCTEDAPTLAPAAFCRCFLATQVEIRWAHVDFIHEIREGEKAMTIISQVGEAFPQSVHGGGLSLIVLQNVEPFPKA